MQEDQGRALSDDTFTKKVGQHLDRQDRPGSDVDVSVIICVTRIEWERRRRICGNEKDEIGRGMAAEYHGRERWGWQATNVLGDSSAPSLAGLVRPRRRCRWDWKILRPTFRLTNPQTASRRSSWGGFCFDKRLSKTNTVACANCHMPGLAFTDGQAVSIGNQSTAGWLQLPQLSTASIARCNFGTAAPRL